MKSKKQEARSKKQEARSKKKDLKRRRRSRNLVFDLNPES